MSSEAAGRWKMQQNISTRSWLHPSSRVDVSGRGLGLLNEELFAPKIKSQGCVFGEFYT